MTQPNNPTGVRKTLEELAGILGGRLHGDGRLVITGVGPFDDACEGLITYAGAPSFIRRIDETRASAVIVPNRFPQTDKNMISVGNPQVAFARAIAIFHPKPEPREQISPDARIGEGTRIGQSVQIGAFSVIGRNVVIGDRVHVHPCCVIEDHAEIGDDTEVGPRVALRNACRIGKRVLIHAGTVIGGDGYGFATDGTRHHKVPHAGIVVIDDDVEIGALNTIDRATFGKTWIQQGVKTDNLVHIAHNVTVGENTLIMAHAGISGSTVIGKNAIIGGQAGISDHLTIGNRVMIAPQSGVAKSIPDGEVVTGSPSMPHKLFLRMQSILPKLPELKRKIQEIDRRLTKGETP